MTKQRKITLSVLALLLVLLVLYFAVIGPWLERVSQKQEPTTPMPLLEGEGYYGYGNTVYTNMGVVYPQMAFDDICQIVVHNSEGEEYLFFHHLAEGKNHFYLGQYTNASHDEKGDPILYDPEISTYFQNFDYTSLYDTQGKIPALLSAVGNVLFRERVFVREVGQTDEEVEQMFHRFGLGKEDNAPWFEITPFMIDDFGTRLYTIGTPEGVEQSLYYYNPQDKTYYDQAGVIPTADGKYMYDTNYAFTGDTEGMVVAGNVGLSKKVYVGNATPSGDAFYVRLAGRDVVYTIATVETATATISLENVVDRDLSYYVNPNLLQPSSNMYDPYYTPNFAVSRGTRKDKAGDSLAVGDYVYLKTADGGFIMRELFADTPSVLFYKQVGDSGFTLLDRTELYRLVGENSQISIEVAGIKSIYDEKTGLHSEAGVVQADSLVEVVYYDGSVTESETGSTPTPIAYTAIIDMTNPQLPDALRAGLLGLAVGEIAQGQRPAHTFTYAPTKQTPKIEFSLLDVNVVFRGDLPSLDPIEAGDVVNFSYRISEKGVALQDINVTLTVDPDSTDLRYATLSRLVLGKIMGDEGQSADEATLYSMPDVVLEEGMWHDNVSVDYAVNYTTELAFSFYYYAGADRNMFLSDSVYKITAPAELTSYAIDSNAVQDVLEIFAELSGEYTVAVGLTPAVMTQYDLHHTQIKYTLAYNTTTKENTSGEITSMTSAYSIPYTLYVSDVKEGYRYVGSQEYDIVVAVPAETLSFLEWGFLERYARRNLMMLNINDIEELVITSQFSDKKETHSFFLSVDPKYSYKTELESGLVKRLYVGYVNGPIQTSISSDEAGTTRPSAGVRVEQTGGWARVIRLKDAIDLDQLYIQNGYTERDRTDYMGVYYFRHLIAGLYSTYYTGVASDDLSPEEIAALLESDEACVTTLSVRIANGERYVFRFYAYSGRRALVRVTGYAKDKNNPTKEIQISDSAAFYMHLSEVKKINAMCDSLTSGIPFDEDDAY